MVADLKRLSNLCTTGVYLHQKLWFYLSKMSFGTLQTGQNRKISLKWHYLAIKMYSVYFFRAAQYAYVCIA